MVRIMARKRMNETDFHKRYVVDENECWIWTAASAYGYGTFGRTSAHRWSYEKYVGEAPEGMHVDHKCNVKLCVNPEHLQLLTPKENTRKWSSTITHCPNGHEYSDENVVMSPQNILRKDDGKVVTYYGRQCRKCRNKRQRDRYWKAKNEQAK